MSQTLISNLQQFLPQTLQNKFQSHPVLFGSRRVSILWMAILAMPLFLTSAQAQERPRGNELGLWFSTQFENGYAFGSSTTNARMYQLEGRFSRLVYTRGPVAVRWVSEIVPLTLVGEWHATNGRRAYAYGGGGSPVGAQVNFAHYRRFEPFVTAGGGFLYFDRPMFAETQFNFTAQVGGGVQWFASRRSSVDFGYKYHHISNANLGDKNPGMDSHTLFVGISVFR
jgi:opacity protein-like surface antigen